MTGVYGYSAEGPPWYPRGMSAALIRWTGTLAPAELGELRRQHQRRHVYGRECPVCGANLATSPQMIELDGPVPSGGRFYGVFCSGSCLAKWHDPEIHGHTWTPEEQAQALRDIYARQRGGARVVFEKPALEGEIIETKGEESCT